MQESAVAGVARGPTHRRVARRFADEAGTALGADFSAKTVGVPARVEPGHRQAVEGAAARDVDRGAERHALCGGRESVDRHDPFSLVILFLSFFSVLFFFSARSFYLTSFLL